MLSRTLLACQAKSGSVIPRMSTKDRVRELRILAEVERGKDAEKPLLFSHPHHSYRIPSKHLMRSCKPCDVFNCTEQMYSNGHEEVMSG